MAIRYRLYKTKNESGSADAVAEALIFNRLQFTVAEMVITNFNGAGVGFGFGVGCGFGVGWGFGGTPLNFLGLGLGGGCGVGLGLGWGFGSGYGSQYHSSGVTFHGIEVGKKDQEQKSKDVHASQ